MAQTQVIQEQLSNTLIGGISLVGWLGTIAFVVAMSLFLAGAVLYFSRSKQNRRNK